MPRRKKDKDNPDPPRKKRSRSHKLDGDRPESDLDDRLAEGFAMLDDDDNGDDDEYKRHFSNQ